MRAESFVRDSDFLREMARASAARVDAARRRQPLAALEERVRARPEADRAPQPRPLSPTGFELIAEVKFSSPSLGVLADTTSPTDAATRARTYDLAGAWAISVLTEPTRFGGSLSHLWAAAQAVDAPVMRKDFLVDPFQVWEAADAGAGGVLLIVRMLDDENLARMVEAVRDARLFALLEAFDEEDLARLSSFLTTDAARNAHLLAGVNGRDLRTLEVDPERHLRLAPLLPRGVPAVAESGLSSRGDAARAARAGYGVVLVGTALMQATDPAERARELLEAGRAERGVRA